MGKSGQDRILIFDCRNQKVHETLPLSGTTALSLAFAPDNAALAIGQQTGKVKILVLSPTESFRSSDRKFGPLEFAAHQNPVTQIAWSRDGRTLATGCNAYFVFGTRSDGEIRLWSAPTGAFQGELLPMDHDKSIVIAPTGHYQAQPSETVIKHNFITYVIQTPGGQQTLTPDDFEQRFRWKNNPHFVRVDQMP
jgi:WD40 repeat protein